MDVVRQLKMRLLFDNYFQIISAIARLRTQCTRRWHRSAYRVCHNCLFSSPWSRHQLLQSRGKNSIGPVCRPPDCQPNKTICEESSKVGKRLISFEAFQWVDLKRSAKRAKWPIRPAVITSLCGMKWLGVFLAYPGWVASPSQGYSQHLIRGYTFTHPGIKRHCESKVPCPRRQHFNE